MFWRRRPAGAVAPGEPRIVLIGRPGCHLCDDAEATIARVATDFGISWRKVSVEEDPDLLSRWGDRVPVTLVDGRPHDFYRVSEHRLRAALSR